MRDVAPRCLHNRLQGADVNYQRTLANNNTALMCAAGCGSVEEVEKLLALGADPHLRDKKGRTAAMHASLTGRKAIATLLRGAERDFGRRNTAGESAKGAPPAPVSLPVLRSSSEAVSGRR